MPAPQAIAAGTAALDLAERALYEGRVGDAKTLLNQAIFSSGLTYEVNENMVLDVGTQVGLSNTADDATVFAGVTRRF